MMYEDIKVGDILMSGPVPGEEDLFQKGIKLQGADHTHDEPIGSSEGKLVAGNAHSPYYELTPFSDKLRDVAAGKRVMAVFRWTAFVGQEDTIEYKLFQRGVNSCIKLMAMHKLPYDKKAIYLHVRNAIREFVPFLGPLSNHKEYHVYCTENCFEVYLIQGIDLNALVGNQPLVAPVHMERLYYQDDLTLIRDFGLARYLKGGK